MITNYLYPIFVKLSIPAPTVSSWTWQKSFHKTIHFFFFISSVSSLNFQAFRLTTVISRGTVKFYNFTCLMSHGDSGSLLVYLEKDGKYTQVGIVSFGSGDGCQVGYAGHTKIIRYLCWIAKHIGIFFLFLPMEPVTQRMEHRSTVWFSLIKVMN